MSRKGCKNKRPAKWTAEYKREYNRKYNREYRLKNGASIRAKCAKWQREHRDKAYRRRENLRYAFGITPVQYDEMLTAQDGKCAVCGDKPRSVRLAVDHDHVTGTVRGLLCVGCNTTVGKLRDSPELVEKLRRYLYKHSQLKLVS